jgi:hypothetical protein
MELATSASGLDAEEKKPKAAPISVELAYVIHTVSARTQRLARTLARPSCRSAAAVGAPSAAAPRPRAVQLMDASAHPVEPRLRS